MATPLTILYTAITITVTPILSDQSGLPNSSHILNQVLNTHIYMVPYYTSIVYYTKDTPILKYLYIPTDNPVWTAGKTLMLTITVEEFDTRISNEKGATHRYCAK